MQGYRERMRMHLISSFCEKLVHTVWTEFILSGITLRFNKFRSQAFYNGIGTIPIRV